MLTVDPAFVQWCIGTATMILFVEKVLAALVHWRALSGTCKEIRREYPTP
jgi:hypothetical protein